MCVKKYSNLILKVQFNKLQFNKLQFNYLQTESANLINAGLQVSKSALLICVDQHDERVAFTRGILFSLQVTLYQLWGIWDKELKYLQIRNLNGIGTRIVG